MLVSWQVAPVEPGVVDEQMMLAVIDRMTGVSVVLDNRAAGFIFLVIEWSYGILLLDCIECFADYLSLAFPVGPWLLCRSCRANSEVVPLFVSSIGSREVNVI